MTKKKSTKRIKPTPAIEMDVVPVSVQQTRLERYFPHALTAVFFLLSLIGILHHEMWRDEFQAWMVARDAHSIPQLFQNLKYEGNPVLWHAFLYIITAVTDSPFFMQLFHILISAAMVFVINRHAPLSMLQKILLTFSYFVFYEYNIISRSYGLGMLLVVSFLALYPQRKKQLWWMALILFLLGNCTIFGVILGGAMAGYLVLDEFMYAKAEKRKPIASGRLIGFSVIALLGLVLGYLQIHPEPNNSFPTVYVPGYDQVRLNETFAKVIHAYLPIPDLTDPHWWNTNLLVRNDGSFFIGFGLLAIAIWIVLFWPKRLVAFLYTGVTLVLLAFYYYSGLMWERYTGHLLVIVLVCYWLMQVSPSHKAQGESTWMSLCNRFRSPVLTGMLAVGCVGGIISYVLDIQQPFSTSKQAADYLREHRLDSMLIIGTLDYAVSPLATHLDRPIYYPESREEGTFIIYDDRRIEFAGINAIVPLFEQITQAGHKQMILVKNSPVMLVWSDTKEEELWQDAMLTDRLNLKLLTHVEPGVVKTEDYYVYLIEEKPGEQ